MSDQVRIFESYFIFTSMVLYVCSSSYSYIPHFWQSEQRAESTLTNKFQDVGKKKKP